MTSTSTDKMTIHEFILIVIAGTASYLDSSLLVSLGVALPIWTKIMHLSPFTVGFISTTLTIMVAFGSIIGGWLSDKFGRQRVFDLDILFVSIGAWIIAFAPNLPILVLGILIAGLASGADLPTSLAVISERMSSKMYGRSITITQIFWTLGIILSQLIGFLTSGMLIGSIRWIFSIIAAIALCNWLIRKFSKPFKQIEKSLVQHNSEGNAENQQKITLKEILLSKKYTKSLVALTCFYLFWNLPANTWGSFVNYFVVTVSNQTQLVATGLALFANILGLVTSLLYMKVVDTRFRYPIMYAAIITCAVAFFVAGFWSKVLVVFAASYIVFSCTTNFCGEPIYKIWTQTFYPVNIRASVTGISYGIVRFLTAIFALFTPLLMSWSTQNFLWIIFGCSLVSGVFAVVIVRMLRTKNLVDEKAQESISV